jgi:DNA-binding ferritin-like protein (Dps family)
MIVNILNLFENHVGSLKNNFIEYKPTEMVYKKHWRVRMEKIVQSFKKMIREKAEYKANRKLMESLPDDYQFVFKKIEKYMFSLALDESVMTVLMDTLESFAVAASDGRSVISIIGEDVGLFCDNLIKKFQVKTWAGKQREKLNKDIHKKFGINIP